MLLAPRPLPLLRRGRRVLGARRDRAARAGIVEEEDRRPRARSSARRSASTSPTSASAGSWSRAWRTCSASRAGPRPTARTCSRAGGCSSSGWRRSTRWSWSSRTSSGPTPACSTSSTTCSSGPPSSRSSSSRSAGRSCEVRPGWPLAAARAAVPRRCTSSSTGSCPGCPESCAAGSAGGRRACRCTRWRRCGCCSIAGCSRRGTALRGHAATSTSSTCRRPCTRSSRPGSTAWAPASARCCRTRPCSGSRSPPPALAALGERPIGRGRAAAQAARREADRSSSTTTAARRSAASTGSSRGCCGRWRTGRSRAATARRRHLAAARYLQEAWRRARRARSRRCWRPTSWTRRAPSRTPPTAGRSGRGAGHPHRGRPAGRFTRARGSRPSAATTGPRNSRRTMRRGPGCSSRRAAPPAGRRHRRPRASGSTRRSS